eukprot:TRINITY_DN4447_c0_g1_i1.p1 TRINITY_DN4447_c0_g1~~TRINITY_DN4447_c0_g1_i1.p1  ORF type:complete len:180 (-),score=24.69 TRINITY_DN4447_c0_g1_i1:61-546(-)
MSGDIPICLELWHMLKQLDFDKLRPLSYPQTDIFIIMFSMTHPGSFERVHLWVEELRFYVPSCLIMLAGAKYDLVNDDALQKLTDKNVSPITIEQGVKLAEEIGAVGFIPFSSWTMSNVSLLFESSVRAVIESKANYNNTTKPRGCSVHLKIAIVFFVRFR